ncbi:MAG: Crp/Fnr family transcriptional regulator [Saprospiraceae bacterium]|nr:Crp/Fnr family transcriptional regulator [Saprospiraceae bacterium]
MMSATNSNIWFLENIDLTGIFCPNKLSHSKEDHEHVEYNKGEYIYMSHDKADRIFFITDGQVKIGALSSSGKEITKAILTKGEVFGELAIVKSGERGDFAIAMEKTTCCVLTKEEMMGLMKEHNALSLFLMKTLGSRALEMESRLESLVFKDSRSRIIEFLLELVEKRGERVGYEYVVRKFITHQEIANLTATSRQTVTTVLNDLRSQDIITFDRRRLLIRDLDALKKEAIVEAG